MLRGGVFLLERGEECCFWLFEVVLFGGGRFLSTASCGLLGYSSLVSWDLTVEVVVDDH